MTAPVPGVVPTPGSAPVPGTVPVPGIRSRVRHLGEPVALMFGRLGLTPNGLTLLGFGITVVGAVLAAIGLWLAAGVVIFLGGAFDMFDGALARAGVILHPAMELDGIRMIASLTFDGYGPAILPATAVPRHMRERFALVPLEGLPRRRVGVAQRRRGLPSAPTRAVIELLNCVANDPAERPEGLYPATVIAG